MVIFHRYVYTWRFVLTDKSTIVNFFPPRPKFAETRVWCLNVFHTMVPGLLYQNSVCFYSLIFIPPSSHGLKPQVAWHIATVMIKHGTWIHPVVLDVPVPMVIATLPGFISRSARHSTSFPPSPRLQACFRWYQQGHTQHLVLVMSRCS